MSNFNFNKVILGGRMCGNPELKTTTSGVLVTSFSIAINRRGSKDNEADFINCIAWRECAKHITQYFRKGSSICVVGSLQRRSWTDQRGNKRYVTEVVVDEVNFVDSKKEREKTDEPIDQAAIEQEAREASAAFDEADFEVISSDDTLPF